MISAMLAAGSLQLQAAAAEAPELDEVMEKISEDVAVDEAGTFGEAVEEEAVAEEEAASEGKAASEEDAEPEERNALEEDETEEVFATEQPDTAAEDLATDPAEDAEEDAANTGAAPESETMEETEGEGRSEEAGLSPAENTSVFDGADVTEEAVATETFSQDPSLEGALSGVYGDITWTLSEDGTLIVSGTGPTWNDFIDEELGITIDSIKKVIIEDGITEIGWGAFYGCKNMTEVTIAGSVKKIDDSAFEDCDALPSIVVPEGVERIGNLAFFACDQLENVTIPASVSYIDDYAFGESTGITIYGYTDSYAEKYAKRRGIAFVSIGEAEQDPRETKCGENLEWSYDGANTLTVSGTGAMYDYDEDDGILPPWSSVKSKIKNVVIENGVTGVGSYTFYKYKSLQSITLPDTITSIGGHAFQECILLNNISFPAGLTTIGTGAFRFCKRISSVTIPGSVSDVGEFAFGECEQLENVEFEEGVESIRDSMFWGCEKLSSVLIPAGVTSLGTYTFNDCKSLTDIALPDGLLTIGRSAFSGTGLTNITIPNSVLSVGDSAFSNCSALTEVTIPEGVSMIGGEVFRSCYKLSEITIPASVTYMGNDVFYDISGIILYGYSNTAAQLHAEKNNLKFISIGTVDLENSGSCGNDLTWNFDENSKTLTVSGTGEMYNDNELKVLWSFYDIEKIVMEDGVTSIGSGAFSDCKRLTNVTIPGSVQVIGNEAFQGCASLSEIIIPDGVTDIGWRAFYECEALNRVAIPASLQNVGGYAFNYCNIQEKHISDLESWLNINDQDGIGGDLFLNDVLLTEITIPDGIQKIRGYAFYGCKSLEEVTFPTEVSSIESYAFEDCEKLRSITISENMSSIGYSAFYGCSNLKEKHIPSTDAWLKIDTEGKIRGDLYINDEILTEITISDGVEGIREAAFYGCGSLEKVIISSGVSWIGNYAFSACHSLKSITIPETVTEIGYSAFESDSDLDEWGPLKDLTICGTRGSYAEEYADEKSIPFIDSNAKSIIGGTITIPTQTYTGKALTPAVSVTVEGIALTAGTDYTVSYTNNKNAGTAVVTVTGINDYTGSITENFTIAKAAQSLKASNISLTYPNSGKITSSGNRGALSYTSLNTAVATVNSSGVVTAKGPGTAKIRISAAATENYKAATKEVIVTVAKSAQSITVKSSAALVAAGKNVKVSTFGAKGKVTFKSGDTAVASVNASTGVVTAKKVGTVRITATAAGTTNYNEASTIVTIKVVPGATGSFTAENKADGISLAWKKVTGATGYLVYRGNSKIATIKSGATVTFTDKKIGTKNNGKKYTYKVLATASTGSSTLSRSLTVFYVTAPVLNSVKSTEAGKASVTWKKNEKAAAYEIEYCLKNNFSGAKKASAKKTDKSKTLTGLTPGKKYYVRIRTYMVSGKTKYYSPWSALKAVTIKKKK